jgi:hypothetical protein
MPTLRMLTCEAPEYERALGASGSDKQTVKDDQMRSTSSKAKIAADEPARQRPGAVTHSAIAHARTPLEAEWRSFFSYGVCVVAGSEQSSAKSRRDA